MFETGLQQSNGTFDKCSLFKLENNAITDNTKTVSLHQLYCIKTIIGKEQVIVLSSCYKKPPHSIQCDLTIDSHNNIV